MRLSRDQLVLRALAVFDDGVSAFGNSPVRPGIGLRFALMYLYAIGDGKREPHDAFWRAIQETRERAHSLSQGKYFRTATARGFMTMITCSVGIDMDAAYDSELWIATMSPDERRDHRAKQASLAEASRRLHEQGTHYCRGDLEQAQRQPTAGDDER